MTEAFFCVTENNILTVKLPRDVDHHVAKALRYTIDDKLLRIRPQKLILDLTETQFMDSSGLGLILGRARTTKEMEIDYLLVNPNLPTQKLLKMSGVDKLISIQSL